MTSEHFAKSLYFPSYHRMEMHIFKFGFFEKKKFKTLAQNHLGKHGIKKNHNEQEQFQVGRQTRGELGGVWGGLGWGKGGGAVVE